MTVPVSPGFTNPGYTNTDPEAGIDYALNLILADSNADLNNVENEIKNNMQMKQKVRDAQAALQKYQSDLQGGSPQNLDADKQALIDALTALGLPSDSSLLDQANKLPDSNYSDGGKALVTKDTPNTPNNVWVDDGQGDGGGYYEQQGYLDQNGNPTDQPTTALDPSQWKYNMSSDERNKILDGQVKTFQSGLQGLADSYSDLSQQYQFELQKASDIYNRTVTFITNSTSKFSQAKDGIGNNVKQ